MLGIIDKLLVNQEFIPFLLLSTFASRYAYFDAKRATPTVLGRAMNNYRFSFKHRMVNGLSEYWLCEK